MSVTFPIRIGTVLRRSCSDKLPSTTTPTPIIEWREKPKAWQYVFFLDLDGHCATAEVTGALDSLRRVCDLVKVLGSYRKADTI